MKKLITITALLTVVTPCFASDYTIRPNDILGNPNTFKRGTIVEDNRNGTYTIREETMPGSGRGNPFAKGKIITPTEDGSYRVQEEVMPGSGRANPWDNGYTIEEE